MRGHCWKVEGDWDGKQYKHDCECGEFVHGGAMNTRRLWAAWRDRGALARVLAEQAQEVEPVAWIVLDEDKVPIMCAPARQMCNDHINDAINDFDIAEASKWVVRKAFTHPAPPPAKAQQVAVPYDQQAMELCDACGWKAIMPDEPCFVCNMKTEAQKVAVPMTDEQMAEAYYKVTCQSLRSQDKPFAFSFCRAIEKHHGIKAKQDHKPDWSAA